MDERKDFLTDILITAIEGGVNYWAHVLVYRIDEGRALLEEHEDGESHILTLPMIEEALEAIRNGVKMNNRMAQHIMSADSQNNCCPDGFDDIDADAADAIAQIAIFGEILYG